MATETQARISGPMRGVTVTTFACLCGVAAALVSGVLVGTAADAATSRLPLAVLAAFVVAQFPVLKVVGVDVSDFGPKEYIYVAFMTFALWFITFAIILTTGVQF